MRPDLNNLPILVHEMLERVRESRAGGTWEAQVFNVAEEAGEFVGAVRRYKGLARRTGTHQEMAHELADVVISAFAAAEMLGVDLPESIDEKIDIIFQRGWKESQ